MEASGTGPSLDQTWPCPPGPQGTPDPRRGRRVGAPTLYSVTRSAGAGGRHSQLNEPKSPPSGDRVLSVPSPPCLIASAGAQEPGPERASRSLASPSWLEAPHSMWPIRRGEPSTSGSPVRSHAQKGSDCKEHKGSCWGGR